MIRFFVMFRTSLKTRKRFSVVFDHCWDRRYKKTFDRTHEFDCPFLDIQSCKYSHVEFLFVHFKYVTQSRIQFRNHVLHGLFHSIALKVMMMMIIIIIIITTIIGFLRTP